MIRLVICACAAAALVPSVASAQWYVHGYLGGNYTQSADVHISQPSTNTDLTYGGVSFEARPLESPQYYGYRFGYTSTTKGPQWGLEFEFLHLKVYAKTGEPVALVGRIEGTALSTTERMDTRVARYSMSHGLNFILLNAVIRQPIGDTAGKIVWRGGLGPTRPHGESVVFGVSQAQYEWAGLGGQASVGAELPLTGRLLGIVEYKATFAKPTITIAGGTGDTTALTHQVALGLGLAIGRR
jgi:hypothetical protein